MLKAGIVTCGRKTKAETAKHREANVARRIEGQECYAPAHIAWRLCRCCASGVVCIKVVANCVVVLNEIMADAGGMATNRAIIHHLLSRLEDFNEWGVCHVLVLVSR